MAAEQQTGREPSSQPPSLPAPKLGPEAPWPALAAYDEASTAFFHGRDAEATELLRLIRLYPLTVLYGKSGLGKSSLLQAGLFPLLRREHFLPVYLRIDFSEGVIVSPLDQVRRRLEGELRRCEADYPDWEASETIWEYLHHKPSELWSKNNFPLVPVLVFDQFEELFSRSGGNVAFVEELFQDLADLIENRIPGSLAGREAAKRSRLDLFAQDYRLVLSFREDFLPDIKVRERMAPSLLRNYLRLEPLSRLRAIEAVERPGKSVLESGVASSIVDFVSKQEPTATHGASDTIEPVLLSLCCAQLNSRRQGGKITRALVDAAGQDILDEFYQQALADAAAAGSIDVARFIEDKLIQGDHFRGDFPKRDAIEKKYISAKQLQVLTDRHRLLRVAQHPDTSRIELIHDRLVPVVRKSRDERQLKQHQSELAQQAEEQRRRADEEHRRAGEERKRAEEKHLDAIRLRKALWRARIHLVLACIAAAMAAFYGYIAVREKQTANDHAKRAALQARLALSRSLVSASAYEAQIDTELATLLALHALEEAPPGDASAKREAGDALAQSVQETRLRANVNMGSGIDTAALSPDQTKLLVMLRDGTLHLLAWPDATEKQLLPDMEALFFSPTFSPDGAHLAAIAVSTADGSTQSIVVWNAESHQVEHRIEMRELANMVRFTPDGRRLVAAGHNAWFYHLSADRSLDTKMESHSRFAFSAVALNPEGTLLATGGIDKTVRLWDMATRQLRRTLDGHTSMIHSLEFDHSGKELISASGDGTARIWEASSGRLERTLLGHANTVFSATYSKDDRKIVTAGADATVRIWDASSGRELGRLCSHAEPVGWARFTNGDRSVVSTSWDGSIKTWVASGHTARVSSLKFSSNGERVASAGDHTVHLWDGTSGEELMVFEHPDGVVTAIAFDPSGMHVASGDASGKIMLWDTATGLDVASLCCQTAGIDAIGFSPDGSRLVSAAGSAGVALWKVSDASLERQLISNPPVATTTALFSPDGRWLAASVNSGTFWLWNTADFSARSIKAHQGQIFPIDFAADSATLVTGGLDGQARLWDIASGQERGHALSHGEPVMDAVFSPDGKRLITSTLKGGIRVWDTSTGERLNGPSQHAGKAEIDLSRDGSRLATFSWDRTARVWDTSTWSELWTHTHREPVDGGAISPDGTHLATFMPYDGLSILPLDLGELSRRANSRIHRELTERECQRYLGRTCAPSR